MLTLEDKQEIILRNFLRNAESCGLAVPNEVKGWVYSTLGYQVLPNGHRVAADKKIKLRFGSSFDDIPDEYDTDGAAFYERINNNNSNNTSASEPTESNTVGNPLREEV